MSKSITKLKIIYCSCGLRIYEKFSHFHKETRLHKERILLYQDQTLKERFNYNKSLLANSNHENMISDNMQSKKISWVVLESLGEGIEPLEFDFLKELEDEDMDFVNKNFTS